MNRSVDTVSAGGGIIIRISVVTGVVCRSIMTGPGVKARREQHRGQGQNPYHLPHVYPPPFRSPDRRQREYEIITVSQRNVIPIWRLPPSAEPLQLNVSQDHFGSLTT